MYINKTYTYYDSSGQQIVPRGEFLLLLQLRDEPMTGNNLYAVTRKVALKQFGHWMIGSANICGKWVTVSGSYGSDGLPKTVDALPKDAVKLPDHLYQAWANGGGHNSAGNERDAMRQWAKDTFKK